MCVRVHTCAHVSVCLWRVVGRGGEHLERREDRRTDIAGERGPGPVAGQRPEGPSRISLADVSVSFQHVRALCGEPMLVIPGAEGGPDPACLGKEGRARRWQWQWNTHPLQGTLRPTGTYWDTGGRGWREAGSLKDAARGR